MKVDGTSVSFDLSELGLTAEQASNERVILRALLDYFNKNFEQSRSFSVGKVIDSRPVGMKDGSRANACTIYMILSKEEMEIFPKIIQKQSTIMPTDSATSETESL